MLEKEKQKNLPDGGENDESHGIEFVEKHQLNKQKMKNASWGFQDTPHHQDFYTNLLKWWTDSIRHPRCGEHMKSLQDYLLRDVNCANKNKQIHAKNSHNHTNRQKIWKNSAKQCVLAGFLGVANRPNTEDWGFLWTKNHTPNEKKNKCSPTPSIKMINVRVVDLAPIFRSIEYHLWRFACFRTSFYRGQICNMAVSTSLTTQGHFGKQNWPVQEHKLQRYKHIDMRWTIPTWWLSHVTPTWRKPRVFREMNGMDERGVVSDNEKKQRHMKKGVKQEDFK